MNNLLQTTQETEHQANVIFSFDARKECLSLIITFMNGKENQIIKAEFEREDVESLMEKFVFGLLFLVLGGFSLIEVSASLKQTIEKKEKY